MSLQKEDMIIGQKLHMEDKNYLWTLGNQKRISRTKSPGASIATYMDIWQKIAKS